MILFESKDVTLRDAEYSDIKDMAPNMRRGEVDEIWAAHHFTPEEALVYSFSVSMEIYSAVFMGKVVAMFGIVPRSLVDNHALVWLLTTDGVEKMPIRFLRLSRKVIRFFHMRYKTLYNFVDSRNSQCLNWIRWSGGKVFEAQPYGVEKMPFNRFVFGGN